LVLPLLLFLVIVVFCVLAFVMLLVNKEMIRSSCVFYYQRMAVCLSSSYLLPFFPVITERLMTPLTIPNMNEFIMLLTKMIGTYGTEIGELLDAQMYTIITKIHELITLGEVTVTAQSDEEREWQDLKRQYFCLLGMIASNHLNFCFVSETNFGHFSMILESIMQGCGSLGDPVSQKHAFSTLTHMTKEWLVGTEGGATATALPEGFGELFVSWLYSNAIPAAFEVPFSSRFNLEDAKSLEALSEMAQFERAVFAALGDQFVQYLTSQLPVTSLQCTPDVVAQYIEGLKSGSTAKQWKKFKSEFILYHRKLR
jgi:hypothetical protein